MDDAARPARSLTRRTMLRLAAAAPLASGFIALPIVQTIAKPHPVSPHVQQLPLRGKALRPIDPGQHQLDLHASPDGKPRAPHVFSSGEVDAKPFRLAALTWANGDLVPGTKLLVRTRGDGGWSEWMNLHDDGHGPDPDSEEATSARRGTEPLIVETEAEAVEVRVEADGTKAVPRDLRVDLIDPGDSDADHDSAAAGGTAAAASRPTIRSRSDWGADESIRESGNPDYGQVRGMFVHHTAGSNTYSRSDVPRIIRAIYAYHVNGRGWRDIGYNFLLDKFGRIWEGRYGGITKAVIGAHTLGYNANAFGASVLGTYSNNVPPAVVLRAFERLIAWKFDRHGVNPSGSVSYPGRKRLPKISGHRDGGATECPGDELYARLDTIRSGVGDASQSSELTLAAHTETATARKRIWFDIAWTTASGAVSGQVQLQRRKDGGWINLRTATVRDGVGVTSANPRGDRTYRLRSSEVTSPSNVERATSETLAINVVPSNVDLTMTRAGDTRPDGEVPIDIDWRVGAVGVTGEVDLQYYRNGRWRHARTATVTAGIGATVLRPSRSQVYRLRATSAASPPGVDTSHPASTSNEFRVVVR